MVLFGYINELLHCVLFLLYFSNKKTTATASLHYNEGIPFHALFLMVRLYSFRLNNPVAEELFTYTRVIQK